MQALIPLGASVGPKVLGAVTFGELDLWPQSRLLKCPFEALFTWASHMLESLEATVKVRYQSEKVWAYVCPTNQCMRTTLVKLAPY